MARTVNFPRDQRAHFADYEWWYLHGYLQNETGRHYGFMFSFFKFRAALVKKLFPQLGLYPGSTIYQLHMGLTDITKQTHHFDEQTFIPWFGRVGASHLRLNVYYGPNHLRQVGRGRYDFRMQHHHRELHLHFCDKQGAVLHGKKGILSFPHLGSTYYYSQPHLKIQGAFELPGRQHEQEFVQGSAWLDHQWGDFIQHQPFLFWAWAGIQLADGSALMIYEVFLKDGRSGGVKGTYINPHGQSRSINLKWRPMQLWQSSKTQVRYPIDYEIEIPTLKLHLNLRADVQDQEMNSRIFSYWEGACSITGTKAGRHITGKAYLELTGYDQLSPAAKRRRLKLKVE